MSKMAETMWSSNVRQAQVIDIAMYFVKKAIQRRWERRNIHKDKGVTTYCWQFSQ
eukprot:m.295619 g.295619  ORF g.295619 m.295619 type:complete len:55 (+) comp59632_c0_seq1:64-228(+)